MEKLLTVEHLTVDFKTDQGTVHAVRDVSFDVGAGEVLGVVGESGSGKSVTMYSIMGLLGDTAGVQCGTMQLGETDINPCHYEKKKDYTAAMQNICGKTMAMVFQDPMTFLNPTMRIGKQLCEPILNHTKPTTALDVTIQAQVLDLIRDVSRKLGSSVILITHDLGVVASLCDRINIMYGGKIVESGTDQDIFYRPNHPYTKGLLSCICNPEDDDHELTPIPGSPPDLLQPPAGCPFVDRCAQAMKICKERMPGKTVLSDTHVSYCWCNEAEKARKEAAQ